MNVSVGFIGQGWIGKHYADDFEGRGYAVTRYALESAYEANKEALADCDVVFIAVPTPTTVDGFDDSIVASVLSLVGRGKIAVLKSTMLPGTTEKMQKMYPEIIVLNSPEFLRESTAAYDAAHPDRNIIGIPEESQKHQAAAEKVLEILPQAPYARIMSARAAELVKYAGNVFLFMKVVYANLLYDLSDKLAIPYEDVRDGLGADPRIGTSHLNPVDASGHSPRPGRGAGGHCFIKDFEAFRELYQQDSFDVTGGEVLDALLKKNTELLTESGKDLDLLEGVYGTV